MAKKRYVDLQSGKHIELSTKKKVSKRERKRIEAAVAEALKRQEPPGGPETGRPLDDIVEQRADFVLTYRYVDESGNERNPMPTWSDTLDAYCRDVAAGVLGGKDGTVKNWRRLSEAFKAWY